MGGHMVDEDEYRKREGQNFMRKLKSFLQLLSEIEEDCKIEKDMAKFYLKFIEAEPNKYNDRMNDVKEMYEDNLDYILMNQGQDIFDLNRPLILKYEGEKMTVNITNIYFEEVKEIKDKQTFLGLDNMSQSTIMRPYLLRIRLYRLLLTICPIEDGDSVRYIISLLSQKLGMSPPKEDNIVSSIMDKFGPMAEKLSKSMPNSEGGNTGNMDDALGGVLGSLINSDQMKGLLENITKSIPDIINLDQVKEDIKEKSDQGKIEDTKEDKQELPGN